MKFVWFAELTLALLRPIANQPVPVVRSSSTSSGLTFNSAPWVGRAVTQKDALTLTFELPAQKSTDSLQFTFSLHFSGGGTTAAGYVYRIGVEDGRLAMVGAPSFVAKWIGIQSSLSASGRTYKLTLPIKALPPFPSQGPWVMDVCAAWAGVSNCEGGTMRQGSLQFSEDFRRALKFSPLPGTERIERREEAWVAVDALHFPVSIESEKTIEPNHLARLATEAPVNLETLKMALPSERRLPNGWLLVPVFSGSDPYSVEGKCSANLELRIALYSLKGRVARRVLEWPVAACSLGTATSVELEADAQTLSIGYSSGAIIHFVWSNDHFERTDLG